MMVARQLQDSLDSMKPEAKKIAPMQVVKPSLTINAAYALFWSRRWNDPLLSMPYRSANLGVQGGRLLEIFDTIPSEPGTRQGPRRCLGRGTRGGPPVPLDSLPAGRVLKAPP